MHPDDWRANRRAIAMINKSTDAIRALTAGDRLMAVYHDERARLRAEREATPAMIRLRTDVLNGAVGGPNDGAAA